MNIDYINMLKHSHLAWRRIQDNDTLVEQLEKSKVGIEIHYTDYINSLKQTLTEQRSTIAENVEELSFQNGKLQTVQDEYTKLLTSIQAAKGKHSSIEEHLQILISDFQLISEWWLWVISEYE